MGASVLFGTVTHAAWAVCVTQLVSMLREMEPKIYAEIGSPTGSRIWGRPFGSDELDGLVLHRQFRWHPIRDSRLRRTLEIAYWLRWSMLLSVVAFAISLAAEAVSRGQP